MADKDWINKHTLQTFTQYESAYVRQICVQSHMQVMLEVSAYNT